MSTIRRRLRRAGAFVAAGLVAIAVAAPPVAAQVQGTAASLDPRATIGEARAAPVVARVEILLRLLDRLPATAAPAWRAVVLDELGGVFLAHGDRRMAHRFYVEAWALQRRFGDAADRVRARSLLADLHWRGAAYGRALHHFTAALTIAAETPRVPRTLVAELWNNRGLVHAALGDRAAAEADLLRSLAGREDRSGIATTLHNLGYARHLAGIAGAERLYREALALRRELDDPAAVARTANNLGDWLTAAGRSEEALPLLWEAFTVYADSDVVTRAIASGTLAQAVVGDLVGAAPGHDLFAFAHVLDSLGNALAAGGADAASTAAYGVALAQARAGGFRELEYLVLVHLAERRIEAGEAGAAVALLKTAVNVAQDIRRGLTELGAVRQHGYATRLSATYRRLADLLLRQDLLWEAERVLGLLQTQEAAEFLRQPRALGEIPLTATESARMADVLGTVDALGGPGLIEGFAPTSPAARAFAKALERLAAALAMPPGGGETIEVADVLRYIEVVQSFAPGDDLAAVEFDTVRLNRMFERFLAALPDAEGTMPAATLEGYDLPPRAAVLYTVVLADRLEVVLAAPVTPGVGAEPLLRHVVTVPADAVADQVAALRGTLASPHTAPAAGARTLYDWIVAPFGPILGRLAIEQLVFVPDGPLRLLPLAALRAPDDRWLAERYLVSYATELSASRRLADLPRPLSVFAGAFGETDVTIDAARFRPLAFTLREVRDLEAVVPGLSPVIGRDFTPDATVAAAFRHDVLHLATHALFRNDAPTRSLVLFGNGEAVSLEAMARWRLRQVELVVLSACETARGDAGEDRQVTSFGDLVQRKGAVAIASLWQIDDGGTAAFMRHFYGHLEAPGTSVAAALAAAQRDLIAGGHGGGDGASERRGLAPVAQPPRDGARYSHPYYWAPFILMGIEAPG